MNARLDRVRALPLHRDLGVQRITSDGGSATLHFTVTDYTVNPAGALHGGVLYTLCDVCAYAALLGVIDDTQEAVTHDLHVSVMSAARLGDEVVVSASVVKRGRSVCFLDVVARVGDRVIATARVTKSLIATD
ncbi:PaaI family thioesterase [Algiphilus sp.]|uniref:PaaI family thioesterase n=1 Tax=Algiphilus sp. TaxID=1872431 RepID=UPI0025BFFACE|nr:PaaI family thioesterase [Algiphilus sp.]MCK5769017.1 PaaI family thioesterase [Algiphilus sp.]